MILSSRYVILNFPKTGSTFTRKMIELLEPAPISRYFQAPFLPETPPDPSRPGKRAWMKRQKAQLLSRVGASGPIELYCPKIMAPDRPMDQHGIASQIPFEFRKLPLAINIRNPFDRYVSMYHFRWYERYPAVPVSTVRKTFPSFPDLTFDEYLDYLRKYDVPTQSYHLGIPVQNIGRQTLDFIHMLAVNPAEMIDQLDMKYIMSDMFRQHLPRNLNLLRTENLNDDLADFLVKVGYSQTDVQFIRQANKVQPGEGTSRPQKDHWMSYYTKSQINRVLEEDKFLFCMLSRLGIEYACVPPIDTD